MPLHLLGKKSWNVYNPANIARVRRDEEAARAREEAEEQRMQEADAARRLAILRGEIPPPLDSAEPNEALPPSRSHDRDTHDRSRKRKRHSEDDTDFEMRIARERASADDRAARDLAPKPSSISSHSMVDSKGHITLFPQPSPDTRPREPNENFTREKARKERELKDQYQMRFVNAAGGRDGQGLTDGGPWYASADGEASAALVPSKDVWGREDPRRKVREAARLDASDPLAMMKRGARMVRELEKERKKEVAERERELRELEKEERRRERRRRREEGRGGRERRKDESDSEGGSGRRERSRRNDRDHGDRERDRSREHGRGRREHGRGRRERMDSLDRRERSHRHHEERRRDRSRDRDRRREEQESRHGRDEERHRRSQNQTTTEIDPTLREARDANPNTHRPK